VKTRSAPPNGVPLELLPPNSSLIFGQD